MINVNRVTSDRGKKNNKYELVPVRRNESKQNNVIILALYVLRVASGSDCVLFDRLQKRDDSLFDCLFFYFKGLPYKTCLNLVTAEIALTTSR